MSAVIVVFKQNKKINDKTYKKGERVMMDINEAKKMKSKKIVEIVG